MKKILSVILATVISFSALVNVTFAANELDWKNYKPNGHHFYHQKENHYKWCKNCSNKMKNEGLSINVPWKNINSLCYLTSIAMILSDYGYENADPWSVYVNNGKIAYTQWEKLEEVYNVDFDTVNLRNKSNDEKLKFVADKLKTNPHGVLIQVPNHMVVAKKNINNIILFDDPYIGCCVPIEKVDCAWSWSKVQVCITITPKTPLHTCPTTPKNNKGQWNFQTKGSKLGACKECGKEFDWLSKIQSITNKKATLKSSKKSYKVTLYKKPYEDAGKAASGKVIQELPVTGAVKNAYGTDWYEVEYQKNKKGYITKTTLEKNYDIGSVSDKSAKKTSTQQESAKSTLKINLTQYPSQHTQGNNFGLRGTVTSNYKITSVKGTVVDSKGKTQLSSNDKPNATSMDIKTSALNNSLSFNKLPVGKYTLKIVAVDSSGKKVEDSKTFTVKAKANQSKKEKTVKGTVKIPSSWDNLSIRKGPSTSYKIVGSMKNGAKCTVYPDKTKDGWYYVKYNNVEGYAAGNRINLQ